MFKKFSYTSQCQNVTCTQFEGQLTQSCRKIEESKKKSVHSFLYVHVQGKITSCG